MKKWFRNLLLIVCLLFSFENKSQSYITINDGQYNQWILSNQACYGCGSFYVMASTNFVPDKNGLYYYNIYLWSNSFYANGFAANTYIKNVNVYAQNGQAENLALTFAYLVVPPKSISYNGIFYVGYVYSYNSDQPLKISWQQLNAW